MKDDKVIFPEEMIAEMKSLRDENTRFVDKLSDMANYSAKGTLVGAITGYVVHRVNHTPLFLSILAGSLLGGGVGYILSKEN